MPGNSQRRGRRTTSKKVVDRRHRRQEPRHAQGSGPHPARRRAAVAQGLLRGRGAARQDRRASRPTSAAPPPPRAGRRRSAYPERSRPRGRRSPGPGAAGRPGRRERAAPPVVGAPRRLDRGSLPAGGRPPRRSRPSCWSDATRCSRRCAPRSRRPRSTSPRASTSTSGSPRAVRSGRRPRHAAARGQPGRARPDDRWRAAPGRRPCRCRRSRTSRSTTCVAAALRVRPAPLLVALDGVTDPRNLGAVIRSAAAFGAQGVFLPERRAAGMTATAWRTSAGAAARLPVAQVTNLTRALQGLPGGRFHRGRPGRRRRDLALRPGGGDRSAGRRGRLRGARPVPPGRRDLRSAGQHPDGVRRWSHSTRRWRPRSPWPRWPAGGPGAERIRPWAGTD